MSFLEPREPISPPEIRIAAERLQALEFYVHLGIPQPERELFQKMADYLADQAPNTVAALNLSYLEANEKEPAMLLGVLIVGAPIDLG